jgi:endo-1,4-beta-xylanase
VHLGRPESATRAYGAGEAGLRSLAAMPIGAAVEPALLESDVAYAETLAREFGSITAENAMKWAPIHPDESVWRWQPADRLVEFARAHNMLVHGHVLVWHEQLPAWTSVAPPRRLRAALEDHIRTLLSRYRGRVGSWDVVNEALTSWGGLRHTIFLDRLGPGYVAEAFRIAHDADPDARLYYNDFGAEGLGRKSDAVHALARELLEDGVPIHGVGLQMHIDAASPPDTVNVGANVARLSALGLDVRISEMDVRVRRIPARDRRAAQRSVYRDLLAACLGSADLAGVSFWGVTDAHSWIHQRFGDDEPLLFDGAYDRKPAYFGVRDALGTRRGAVSPGARLRVSGPAAAGAPPGDSGGSRR